MLAASDFSKRDQALTPSPTLAVSKKAKEMAAAGVDVINLGMGEPDFQTPAAINQAAIAAIEADQTSFYTPVGGILPLRQAIADRASSYSLAPIQAKQVTVTTGAKLSLYVLMQALLDPGDVIVTAKPYWVSYAEQAALAGADFRAITPNNAAMKLTVADLEAMETPVKVLLLNNPTNPTGQVYSAAEISALLDWAKDHDTFVILDEIYGHLVYNGHTFTSGLSLQELTDSRLIIVDGVSKSYSMTGWRLGWTIADESVIAAMNKLLSHMTSNPTAVSQYAALAAVSGDQQVVADMRRQLEDRLNRTYDRLTKIPGLSVAVKPAGAFYLFFQVAPAVLAALGLDSSQAFASRLLEEAHVALPAGEGFGMPGYLRLSYAKDQAVIDAALDRIETFLAPASAAGQQ